VTGGNPQLLERYELKFTIPFDMIDPISRFASIYCSPDRHSVAVRGGFYRVHNLYLDTPGLLFLRNRRHRVPSRFNMRVRSYGNEPALPFFLEVKQRVGGVIRKYRAPVRNPDWHRVFTEPGSAALERGETPIQVRNRELFERLVLSYQARPWILTQYVRKAWVSDVDDYARVTFDVDLRFAERREWDPVPDDSAMQHYDLPASFDPGCSVILELKCCASRVPLWMVDLIHTFSLRRRSFSKYMFGMGELLTARVHDPATRVATAETTRC
jgi:hypothetical protein